MPRLALDSRSPCRATPLLGYGSTMDSTRASSPSWSHIRAEGWHDMEILNQERAEAFGARLMAVIDDASLAMLTSVGHRTELFDALAGLGPSTSDQVARAAALDERYV